MHMLDDRPPTLNTVVVECVATTVARMMGCLNDAIKYDEVRRTASQLVMGSHYFIEFEHPSLGTCRIHTLGDVRQDDYVYAMRLATAQCRLLGVMTETLNEAIAQVVEQYYRTYPDYRRPGM